MEVFPIDWKITEHEFSFEITCYGKLNDHRSICIHIPFTPYFFVECPPTWQASRAKIFVAECLDKFNALPRYSLPLFRKTFGGFTNCEPRLFVQLAFATVAGLRKARKVIADRYKMKTYEANVDQILRLFHVRSIKPAQWFAVHNGNEVAEEDRTARTDLEITAAFTDLSPVESQAIPPLVFASWDLECFSAGGFPMASRPSDVICTICTNFCRYGEEQAYLKHCVTLGGCDPIPGMTIESYDTEAEVVNAWLEVLCRESADILLGYNTYGFDYRYVYGRSLICVDDATADPLMHLHVLGRSVEGGGVPVQKSLSSAAYGENNYFYLKADGILHFDLLQLIKKEHKYESYSLNFVAKQILGDAKIDLSPAEIFSKFKGTDTDRAVIAEYCCKDVALPLQILQKMAIFQNYVEMANATSVPIDYLLSRGETIKVFSLILQKARSLGFVIPDIQRSDDTPQEKYEGATVLNAERGAYLTDIISCLDFASLYPSIMRAHRMCPSTLVRDEKYDNLPGVDYYTVNTPQGTYKFAQVENAVVPSLLNDLSVFRSTAKKRMAEAKAAGDSFNAAVQNGKQLAYKIAMNSCYGFFGASRGFFPSVEIAAAVTTTGRNMIATTKALVEGLNEGSRVVYGDTDSVMCIFNCGEENRTNMARHFEMAQHIADTITEKFQKPNQLEFEKCFFPFLLFSKKRYAGMLYAEPHSPAYMEAKGLQLVRRDNCQLVKTVSTDVLQSIMKDKSAPLAVAAAKTHLLALLRNENPMTSYITSKSLKSEYKFPETQPHVQVSLKIYQRRGYPVNSGERVPYVFIEDSDQPDALQAKRAEDPAYAEQNGLIIDRLHYLDSQISGPVETLLDVLAPGTYASLVDSPEIKTLIDDLRAKKNASVAIAKRLRKNSQNNQREITKFFSRP